MNPPCENINLMNRYLRTVQSATLSIGRAVTTLTLEQFSIHSGSINAFSLQDLLSFDGCRDGKMWISRSV